MLAKLGKAMGGAFEFPTLEGEAAEGEEGEEEEVEATVHAAASAGACVHGAGRVALR